MATDTYADYFDFVVTDIAYVIQREPDADWGVTSMVNSGSYILAYATSGLAHYRFAGREDLLVREGDVLFFPKGMAHSGHADKDEPWSFLSVAFDAVAGAGNIDEQLSVVDHLNRGSFASRLSAHFAELYLAWTQRKPGYLVRCRAIIMTILHELIRQQTLPHLDSPHARELITVIDLMRADYRRTYAVTDLAERVGLSPSHFRALFKQFTGLTAKEYQHRIKIAKAKEFLLSGECNVTQAATRVGFADIYYFSRLFKKVEGRNPSELTRR